MLLERRVYLKFVFCSVACMVNDMQDYNACARQGSDAVCCSQRHLCFRRCRTALFLICSSCYVRTHADLQNVQTSCLTIPALPCTTSVSEQASDLTDRRKPAPTRLEETSTSRKIRSRDQQVGLPRDELLSAPRTLHLSWTMACGAVAFTRHHRRRLQALRRALRSQVSTLI
jgi:hypothetical protein